MLPYIGGQAQKPKARTVLPPEIVKEWPQTKRQLEMKAKTCFHKLTAPIVADFHKICRLKEIPEFYSMYFLVAVETITDEELHEWMSIEIRNIINQRSCYHKINDLLALRPELVKKVLANMEMCEGFQEMNAGKPLKPAFKAKINEYMKDVTSLEQIKAFQKKSILDLSNSMSQLRKNSLQVFQSVKLWREYLLSINPKKPKFKVIFPHQGINCILTYLYDQEAIVNFLSKEFIMNNEKNPFLMFGKQSKRKTQLQVMLKQEFGKDGADYGIYTQEVMMEFPIKETQNRKEKEQLQQKKEKQENKFKMNKQIRDKSKTHSKMQSTKQDTNQQSQQPQSNAKAKSTLDIESILIKEKQKRIKKQQLRNQQKDYNQRQQIDEATNLQNKNKKSQKIIKTYSSSKKSRASTQNQQMRAILNQKSDLQKQLKQAKIKNREFQKLIKRMQKQDTPRVSNIKLDSQRSRDPITNTNRYSIDVSQEGKISFRNRVEAVYNSRRGSSSKISSSNLYSYGVESSNFSVEELMSDNRSLQKQVKQQIRDKKTLQKMLKVSQTKNTKNLALIQAQKAKLQLQIKQLQAQNKNKQKIKQKNNQKQDQLKKSKSSVVSIYSLENGNRSSIGTGTNLYQSSFLDQREKRINLQNQIKEVMRDKGKLEKEMSKSQDGVAQEREQVARKLQKYEQTIKKLKQQYKQLKSRKQQSEQSQTPKKAQSLRMYTTTAKKQKQSHEQQQAQLHKSNSVRRFIQQAQSANYFNVNVAVPENKKKKHKTIIDEDIQHFDNREHKRSGNGNGNESGNGNGSAKGNKVEIIQTKRTIQIIYDSQKKSRKSKEKAQAGADGEEKERERDMDKDKDRGDTEELLKVLKEKETLIYQLEKEEIRREKERKDKQRRLLKQQDQIQRYKQIIERQRQKKHRLQNKIKSLKKSLYQQFEQRLKSQKQRFKQQKKQLLAILQSQKGQKQLQQRYLQQKMKYFKQMEANESHLIKLLHIQKKNRIEKQHELAEEINKKEQLLNFIQILEIKKGLEQEIRAEWDRKQEQGEDQRERGEDHRELEIRRDELKREIQSMNQVKDQELRDIDQQNQKLKELIKKIKDEENRLINTMKQNIYQRPDEDGDEEDNDDDEDEDEYDMQLMEARKVLLPPPKRASREEKRHKSYDINKVSKTQMSNPRHGSQMQQYQYKPLSANKKHSSNLNLQQVDRIFNARLKNAEQLDRRRKNQYTAIKQSPSYKEKQSVQNIIEMYLQNPHKYPSSGLSSYSPQQKKQISAELYAHNKRASSFERELLNLKEMQKVVPTASDDIMTSHLLNLKKQYENQESGALREHLFPAIRDEDQAYPYTYPDKELSFESEEPAPPKTIKQHVQVHGRKFPMKKKDTHNSSKNFLNINKVKLVMMEVDRKEKEKQLIQEEARRRVEAKLLSNKFRQSEEKRLQKSLERQRLKDEKDRSKGNIKGIVLAKDKKKDTEEKEQKEQKEEKYDIKDIQTEKKDKEENEKIYKQIMEKYEKYTKKKTQEKVQKEEDKYKDSFEDDVEIKINPSIQNNKDNKNKESENAKNQDKMSRKSKEQNNKQQEMENKREKLKQEQKDMQRQKQKEKEIMKKNEAKQKQQAKQKIKQKEQGTKVLTDKKREQKQKKQQQQNIKAKEEEKPKQQVKQQNKQKNKQQINGQSKQSKEQGKQKTKEQSAEKPKLKENPKEKDKQGASQLAKQKQMRKAKQKQKQQQMRQAKEKEMREIKQKQIEQEKQKQKQKQERQREQREKQQQQAQEMREFDTNTIMMTNNNSQIEREKEELESEIYRYQQEIRTFISRDEKYQIYQHFISEAEINTYISNMLQISSAEIKALNSNTTLLQDIPTYTSTLLLISKSKQNKLQTGLGIFHKQYNDSTYICDYMTAHKMSNFLNVIFSFCRYIFTVDGNTNRIQFMFDLSKLKDQVSIEHFVEFQEKCKRMGEVYVKMGKDQLRKYVLRRNLFQGGKQEKQGDMQVKEQGQGNGLKFGVAVQVHADVLREKGKGFVNTKNAEYFSTNILLSLYMKKNEESLAMFRKNAQSQIKYRQLLMTTLMLQKNNVDIKNCEYKQFPVQQRFSISKKLRSVFKIDNQSHGIEEMRIDIQHSLPEKTKRCTFKIEEEETHHLILYPEEPVTKIQSSNSSQIGIFLPLIPKYKVLLIEANQFQRMHSSNPEVNTFFYVKHFIKNIQEIQKEPHPRIFLPEVVFNSEVFLKDFGDQIKMGVLGTESVEIGWADRFSNSILFLPTHKDLVIKKPLIVAVLSGVVERVVQGTPIVATLIE